MRLRVEQQRHALGPPVSALQIKREGTKLVVLIAHGLVPADGKLQLEWDVQSELLAEALTNAVAAHVATTIRQLRQEEYESGYRDHTRRLPRRDSFRSDLGPVLAGMKDRRS